MKNMEQLNSILKNIDKDRIKTINVEWVKILEDKAFPKITIELYSNTKTQDEKSKK